MSKLEVTAKTQPNIEAYRRLLQRDPGSLRFAEFADQVRRQGDLSGATALCARGLLRHPHYATGRVVMGEILRDQGLLERAEQEWREALRLDPGHPRAHLRMGELYLERGEIARATAALEACLLFQPDSAEARRLLESARKQRPRRRRPAPSDRVGGFTAPGWLSVDRYDDLLSAVRNCPSVESALLADPDGLLLATDSSRPQAEAEDRAAVAVELVQEVRRVFSRLGAGKLRSALLRGSSGSARCVRLGDFTLIAAVKPGAPIGAANAEVEEAIARVSHQARAEQYGE